jgi:hypothetical protein
LLDHRVFFGRVEVARATDDAPDVGFSVARVGSEDLGGLPAASFELADIGFFQFADELAIASAPQLVNGGLIDARIRVDEVVVVR